jgi:primary-amine oxidase
VSRLCGPPQDLKLTNAPLCRNIHLPGKPTVDFDQFFDGESLDQEDLVVWLNLGMHHINRAEDSPHTLTNIATSSVLLTPFNFNDYDVGMEAQNAVLVHPAAAPGDLWLADENSVSQKFCLPAKPSPFKVRSLSSPFSLRFPS